MSCQLRRNQNRATSCGECKLPTSCGLPICHSPLLSWSASKTSSAIKKKKTTTKIWRTKSKKKKKKREEKKTQPPKTSKNWRFHLAVVVWKSSRNWFTIWGTQPVQRSVVLHCAIRKVNDSMLWSTCLVYDILMDFERSGGTCQWRRVYVVHDSSFVF